MNEKTKESKFLDAINKYAESQKAQITQEIEDYKNTKIEQATEQGLQDAYDLIHRDIAARKAAIVTDTAKRELNLKRELYGERQRIADEVFAAAESKLKSFTRQDDYRAFISKSCESISELFGAQACVVRIAPSDAHLREEIASLLPHAEIVTDPHILLGGISAYCEAKGITADDTLDTRLNDQRAWFYEHCGLKVV